MRTTQRLGAHLTVLALGLVAAGLHGVLVRTHPAASSGTYRPPAFVAAAPSPGQVHTLDSAPTPHPVRHTASAHPRATARPNVAHHVTTARTTRRVVHRATTSFASALAAAVAKIPTYRAGESRWVVSSAYDFWGTADWYDDILYVNPDVPLDKLYDVAVHEWSHELSVLDYGGDVNAAMAAMNAWFGGSSLTGAERAADCMAILQGATWTHYTTCTDATWRAGAAKLLAGNRL